MEELLDLCDESLVYTNVILPIPDGINLDQAPPSLVHSIVFLLYSEIFPLYIIARQPRHELDSELLEDAERPLDMDSHYPDEWIQARVRKMVLDDIKFARDMFNAGCHVGAHASWASDTAALQTVLTEPERPPAVWRVNS